MSFALARALLQAGTVTPSTLGEALHLSATRGTSLVRALLSMPAIDKNGLERVLDQVDAPYVIHVSAVPALVEKLPAGLCERLLAVPVRQDPRTGSVDVAVADARDPHAVAEIRYFLRAPARMVRTSLVSLEAALQGIRRADSELAIPLTRRNVGAETGVDLAATDAPLPEADEPVLELSPKKTPPALPDEPVLQLTPKENLESEMDEPVLELAPKTPRPAEPSVDPILALNRPKPAEAPDEEAPPPTRTIPGPFSPQAPAALPDVTAPIVAQMQAASDRDRILELLVTGAQSVAKRVAVLAVRRDAIVGWTGSPSFATATALRGVRLANSMPTLLHDALEAEGAHLIRVPLDAAHAPLIAVMSPVPSAMMVIAPVQTEGKAVAVVVADELEDGPLAIDRIGYLARTAGESFGRLLRERRKGC